MKTQLKTLAIISVILVFTIQLFGQSGPGGVGDNTTNSLWLRADDISVSAGQPVTVWPDTSGNANNFEQANSGNEPVLQIQNGIKVVRFDGSDDYMMEESGFGGYTARTALIVYRVDANLQQNTDLGQLWGNYDDGVHVAVDARGGSLQGFSFDGDTGGNRAKFGVNGAAYSAFSNDSPSGQWIYGNFEIATVEFEGDRTLTRHFLGTLFPNFSVGAHQYGGDVAEVIIFNTQINNAQRIIIENYLAAKFGIAITNDIYTYQDTYKNDVAGLGQKSALNHISSWSGSVLKIENLSDLADDEFLMFGHDNGTVNSWTTTNTPFSGNNISRISRTWRLDETGDVGNIDVTIDTSLFAARPAGYSKFVVMLDSDGDFSDSDRIYELVSGGGNEFFSISGLEINDGDYLTIAAVKPVVQFSLANSSGFEDGVCSVEVSSNFTLQSSVTVQVSTADISATAGSDYVALSNQDVTINAGSISTSVAVIITDDGDTEDDQTFTLTLTSAIVEIGAQNVHTYTIHDNDQTRKIYFADVNPSVNENSGTLNVTLEISSANASTSVDYRVIGGTATSIDDYTLADGTLTFDAGTTKDISIALNNDAIPEPDETLIIELYNPIQGNLSQTGGQPIIDTITITDDGDEARKISFLTDSVSNSENITNYSIQLGLTGVTGYDVDVDYTISGNGIYGTDHNLASGNISILAGNTTYNLDLPILNDDVEESMDTIVITLSNPTNADLGTKTVFKYYVLNDDFGYTGPGGIGSNVAVPQWFRADKDVAYDGSNNVTQWNDYSGNGYHATPGGVGTEPLYVASAVNGMPAIEFAGGPVSSNPTDSEWLQWTASGTGYQAQEVFAVFQAVTGQMDGSCLGQIWGSYMDSMHVAIEARSGADQNGFSFDGYPVLGGQARYGMDGQAFNAYSTGSHDYLWSYDQWHLVTADFNKVNTLESNNIGHLEAAGGGNNDYWFGGRIAEIAVFSSTVDNADRIIIENYLAAKYGLTITNDYYAHQATYKYDLAGIGQIDADNYHSKAQSGGMLTLSEASNMGNGEFFMYAHDNGDISSWTTTEIPGTAYQRIAREWRFDQTGGSLGTFTVEVDLSNAGTLPSNITQLVLLVDADGDFSSGATEYVLVDQGSNIYSAENLTISDDDYVTISGKIPTISFEASFISVVESNTSPSINLVLSENAPVDVTVDYVLVAGGTADDGGVDFTFTDGQAIVSTGTSSTTINFAITDDTDSESNEYLFIRIQNPSNANIGTFSDLTFYILDNDGLEWQGPGGIGNLSDQVNVWLRTTTIGNIEDRDDVGDGVNAWINQSENAGLDAFQSVTSQQPTFYSTTVQWNNRPVIDFQSPQREFLEIVDNKFMNTASNAAPQTQRSILVVFRPSSDVTNRQVIFEEGGGARGLNIYLENGKIHLGAWNDVDDAGPGTAWKYRSSNSTIEGNKPYFAFLEFDTPNLVIGDGEVRGTVNGTAFAPIAGAGTLYAHGGDIGIGAMNNATCFDGDVCPGGEGSYFDGYIAEFVSSNVIYNEAQKHILFNYLSSKFGIQLTSTDYYAYDNNDSYSYELFGIGQIDINNSHIAAQGSGIIKIENPQNLGDGEFMLIGHDTNLVDGWVQNNIPNADSNIYRIERTWRVDETGELGTITLKVDTTYFAACPGSVDYYCLIIDADGDFTSGSTVKLIKTKDADDLYTISGVDFAKGDYFTIGCIKPAIDFLVNTGESLEPAGTSETINATLSLNVALTEDVTIDYSFENVTASNGSDYNGTNGTFTMTAGNTLGNIAFDINNDVEGEGNETFNINLSNVNPTTVAIGYDTTLTYTIIDDDETRKVNFGEVSRPGAENIGEDTAFVVLTTDAPGAGVSVDYEILGSSTATNGNVDYNIAQSGTLNFASGEDSVMLIFDINDDMLDEVDETIEFRLSNPIGNLNLGDDVDFTYTINDNDALPAVQFGDVAGSGMESFSPINIPVVLNAVSGQDIEVTFEIDGAGTASGAGVDYTLGYTTVTIPAGEDTAYISVTIVNDRGQDDNETIILNMLNADYATVAGNTTYTYTIIDDDFGGWEGPGGIGNLDNQVGCWLRSTQVYNITNGVDIGLSGSGTMWEDQSNNGNNAYKRGSYGAPVYYDDDATWNKRPVLWFKSHENDILEIADNDEMNRPSGAQSKRTLIVVFRPTDDISSRQVIYEEGGGWRGLNIYIEDDTLNIGGYNVGGQAGEVQWSYIPIRYELQENTPYFAILQFNFEGGSGDVRGALNGSDFTTLPGADLLYPHGDNIGIGGVNGGALGIGNVSLNANTSYYNGYFAEFMSGNFVYNTAQLLILQNYLAAKYNINIGTKDIYDYDAIHGWELLGIGQKAGDNSHNKAQGQGMILLSNPSDLDNDEFMLIGHDAGLPYDNTLTSGIEEWITKDFIDIPNNDTNFVRVAQEWRVDMVGDVGTVNIDVDLRNQGGSGQFDVKDPEFDKYIIMVDADGDFTTGATVYELKEDITPGNEDYYVLENYDFNVGDYFTVGLGNPAIGFVKTADEEMEDVGAVHPVEVKLNMVATTSITVDYKIETIDATSDSDYTNISGTLTFAAGQTSKTLNLTMLDDGLQEDDETFNLILYNSTGAILTQDTLLFTIHDDDNANKVNFALASDSDVESTGSYLISVTRTDGTGTSEVDYIVAGGTAINGVSDDYILADGTVSFVDTETSKDITITINEDAIDENDETIIIDLTNPSSCALGVTPEFTLTITDNDAEPTVQFSSATGYGSESYSPVQVAVNLSTVSGKDVSVSYTTTDGTAANGGIDYNLADGTLVISAGETVGYIETDIFNDLIPTADKDFTINLTDPPTNATLGANSSHVYTIIDDDDLGFEGPGGVGNGTQYALWYRANAEAYTNGQTVSPFNDQSGNANHATLRSGTPSFTTNVMNGQPAVYFDGSNEMLEIPRNDIDIDNASYTVKSIVVAFQTSGDVTSRQVLYEQGGSQTGMSIYIYNNLIYYTAYNYSTGGWNMAAISNNISTNTSYYAILVFDKSDELSNGTLKGYLNGELIGTNNTISESFERSNNRYNGLGGMRSGMRYENGTNATGDGNYFQGYIAEVTHYNFALNEAQRVIVENYMSSKYGAAIVSGSVKDNYKSTHGYHIAGIGQQGTDNHIKAQGTSRATLAEPSGMASGDYMLIGDDNGDISTWNAVAGLYDGTALFLDREWRISKTGTGLATVQLGIDVVTSPTPTKPVDYPTYILIVDPDNDADGDISTSQSDLQIYPLASPIGNTLRIDAIALNDGDYIRVGVAKNRSQQSGPWNDPNTWLTNTVPSGSSETAYITSGHTVEIVDGAVSNTVIGTIIVESAAILNMNERTSVYNEIDNSGTVNLGANAYLYMYNSSVISNNNSVNFGSGTMVLYYGAQEIGGFDYSNLYLANSISSMSANTSCENFYHYYNANLTISNTQTFEISKYWLTKTNSIPTLVPNQSTIKITGSGNYFIGFEGTIYNLEIDKLSGYQYNSKPTCISNNLILTNGVLYAEQDIIVENNAANAIQGGSSSSYVRVDGTGALKREVATGNTYNYPVGDNNEYSPVNVTLNSATLAAGANISVSVDDSKHPNIGDGAYITRQWAIKPTGITNPVYGVELFYTDADIVGNEGKFMPVKYDDDGSNLQHGDLGDIDVLANKLYWNGLTSFSVFTGADYAALPVELVDFKGYVIDDYIALEWFTASEKNNEKFEIEKSIDGVNFYKIDEVFGNGNSDQRIDYTYIDQVPVVGESYYRLRQKDFDGKEELSKIISISYYPEVVSNHKVAVYPNPASNESVNILLSGYNPNEKVEIYVFSYVGALVKKSIIITNHLGNKQHILSSDSFLEPGVYLINIKSSYGIENKRLIIE